MPPRIASLTDLLNSLDAATYFFVSSGMVIAITAALFFALGLWLGQILWRRYKRLFRQSEEVIESFKGEVALLKRRLAEQSTRPMPGMGPSPLQSIAFRAAAPRPSPPAADKVPTLQVPLIPEVPVVTDDLVSQQQERAEKKEASGERKPDLGIDSLQARRVTSARVASGRNVSPASIGASVRWPGHELLFAPSEVLMVPRSRAFCLWTATDWSPPEVRSAPTWWARGFSIWTEPAFQPACKGPQWPGKAHTLWTVPGWTSPLKPGPPVRSARAFTIWTESGWKSPWNPQPSKAFSIWTEEGWSAPPVSPQPLQPAKSFTLWIEAGWQPLLILPWSKSFSLWTDPAWSPTPIKAAPWPASAAASLWTSSEFAPACRGPVLPSRAFTKWTEKGWSPPSVRRQPLPPGAPFTLWAAPPRAATPSRGWFGLRNAESPSIAEKQGFVARTFAAAQQALGLRNGNSSVTARAVDVPAGPANENSAIAQVPPPLHRGPFPPSSAFTLWGAAPETEAGGTNVPHSDSPEALQPPQSHASSAASSHAPSEANNLHSTLLPPLALEPLRVPGEGSPI